MRTFFLGAMVAMMTAAFVDTAAQAPVIEFAATALDVEGIGKVAAEIGRFSVLEDRARPEGRRIELVFARLRSTAAQPGPPIVYLDGGPGGSGIGLARVPDYYRLFDALRAAGDVILLSQRGTGFSTPRLSCRGDGTPVPGDVFSSAERMTAVLGPRTIACARELRAKGIDLGAYNSNASADDLEDLRLALGAPKLTLFGFSYGTHLGLTTVRRHPASIDRLVLAGTEGPDDSQKYPHTFDLQLARLGALEAGSANPPSSTLAEATQFLLDRAHASPMSVPVNVPGRDAPITLTIGKEGLQYLLRRDLGDTNDTANLIAMIRTAARGDYGMLARFAGRRFAELGGGSALMGTAMDCASGMSAERRARIDRGIAGSLLGRMTNYPFPDICEALDLPALPDSFRTPVLSRVPTLFISGSLDAHTPPYQAEEVRWGFPNSTHTIVENAGHESTLPLPEVQSLIVDFLKGIDVTARRIVAASPLP